MEIAKLKVDGVYAGVVMRSPVTAGLVGATIRVEYAAGIWEGLTKTVVFRGSVTKDVVTNDTTIKIPPEVLTKQNERLQVGFYGVDAAGKLIIPTVWADLGRIQPGADPSGDPSTDPSLPVWGQIADRVEGIAQDVEKLKQGGGPSTPGADGEDGGYYIPELSQPDEDTIQFAFTPSKADMPAVEPVTVELPVGQGSGGNVEEHNTDPYSHADIRKHLSVANIVESASGDVITVSDASDMELAGLRIFGKTIQNGTPTPDAPVPLESVGESVNVTVTDENLLSLPYHNSDGFTQNGIQYTIKPNGAVICNGTATAESLFTVKYLMALPAGTYFLCGCPLASGGQLYLRTEDKGVIVRAKKDGAEFTLTKDDTFTVWVDIFTGTKVENVVFYPVISKKYQSATVSTPNGLSGIPVSSGGNYTDENGQQWVCDEVDFEKGVYVQRVYRFVLTGTETFISYDSGKCVGLKLTNEGIPRMVIPTPNSGYNVSPCLFTHGKVTRHEDIKNSVDSGIAIAEWSQNQYCYFDSDVYGSPEEMKSTVLAAYNSGNPFTLLYALATPIETALPAEELAAYAALHTNYPNTTVFNDGGAGMEVKYVADTKLYVDKKFAELSMALLNQ